MQDMWVRHAERALIPLESLKRIAIPVLLICGSRDDPRRIKQAHLFAETTPMATYIEVLGGRHAVHHDHAAEVESIIARFLQDPLSVRASSL
jgi:pimeloyl-ACP methyl ester carboxylesterase